MDHSYIEEHNIVARYGMGKLSAEECVRFEEHFVDCRQCLEQLETTHDLRQAFKTMVAEDAVRTKPFRRAVSSWRPALIAVAACLVVLVAPTFVLLRQARLAHTELNQANAAAESWHRQYVAEQQASAELKKQLAEASQKGQQNSNVATAALPVATAIFALETVRGGEPVGAEPVNQIVISRSAQSVTLSVDRGDLEDARSYHATLADSRGRALWQLGNLEPVSSSVGITVPTSLLHAGDYLLTLEGFRHGGNVSRAYPFRVKYKQ